MMRTAVAWIALISVVEAHYIFRNTVIRGVTAADWVNVRKPDNEDYSPLPDITSKLMTCRQSQVVGVTTKEVSAGESVGITVSPFIIHPGPVSFWMAQAPEGQTAQNMTGEGTIWFKIHQDSPVGGNWPASGKKLLSVDIPKCIPSGEYLLRLEQMYLQPSGGGDYDVWVACAQLAVVGGSGSAPSSLVPIPGAYKAGEPGLTSNDFAKTGVYKPPGPAALQC